MAKFDAEELGKRLEELNRDQLATIEKLTEELLHEMRRKGPVRAGTEHLQAAGPDREGRGKDPRRRQPTPRVRRLGGEQ